MVARCPTRPLGSDMVLARGELRADVVNTDTVIEDALAAFDYDPGIGWHRGTLTGFMEPSSEAL